MRIEVPLYSQEKRKTCVLACLRMVLVAFGTHVSESDIEAEARLEQGGTPIEELERFPRHFRLVADIQEPNVDQLRQLLAEGDLVIAYIDRAVFDLTPRLTANHSPSMPRCMPSFPST